MTSITQLNRGVQVADSEGKQTERMYNWAQQITQLQILTGSGSPEGVVEAKIETLYMNTAGTAGSILYIKRDADVGGDRTQGWILV